LDQAGEDVAGYEGAGYVVGVEAEDAGGGLGWGGRRGKEDQTDQPADEEVVPCCDEDGGEDYEG